MPRKPLKDLLYTLAENSSGNESEEETIEPSTTAQENNNEDTTVPNTTESDHQDTPAREDESELSEDENGFIDKKQAGNKKRQKIKWTNPNVERKLLLFRLMRKLRPADEQKIVGSFDVGASTKLIAVHISKMRRFCYDVLNKARIWDVEGIHMYKRPSEASEQAQDATAAGSPMHWDAAADRDLLLYCLERRKIPSREHGRIARHVRGRPTRQAINERLDTLIEESRKLLA